MDRKQGFFSFLAIFGDRRRDVGRAAISCAVLGAALLTLASSALGTSTNTSALARSGGVSATASPLTVSQGAARLQSYPPTYCGGNSDHYTAKILCLPHLPEGLYTLENVGSAGSGLVVTDCLTNGYQYCTNYSLDDPGVTVQSVPVQGPGTDIYIYGMNWLHQEYVAISATYTGLCSGCQTSGPGHPGKPTSAPLNIERCRKQKTNRCVAITFAPGSSRVNGPTRQLVLEPLLEAVRGEKPAARLIPTGSTIRIEGYTDNVGSRAYRQRISVRRAVAVRAFLQKRLGRKYRYLVVGHGSSDPLVTNATAAGRQQNRRVEISYVRCNPGNPSHCKADVK